MSVSGQALWHPWPLRDPPHLSPCPAGTGSSINFHVYALKFSWCCLVFSISSTTHCFPLKSLPLNVCQAGLIWMGQSTSLKMPSAVGLSVVQERKIMWLRQEICCLAFAPTCCLSPGQPCFSCPLPDRPCRWQASSLQGGVPVHPHSVGLSWWHPSELLSPSSQSYPWAAHLETPQISRGSLCVQCK